MASAGHSTTLKMNGTAVAVTAEATTSLSASVYQVTNTGRRIWDPSAAITVKDGGVAVSSALWSFDYLFGKVTFSGYTPSGAITVDGSYLPLVSIAEVRSFNFSFSPTMLDVTSYDSAGAKQKLKGLDNASGSFESLGHLSDDLDTGTGGVQSIESIQSNATPMLLEATFGGTGHLRAWVLLDGVEESAEVDGLVTSSANYQLAARAAGASYGFDF